MGWVRGRYVPDPWELLSDDVLFSRLPAFYQKMFANDPDWRNHIGHHHLKLAIEDWEAFHPDEARVYQEAFRLEALRATRARRRASTLIRANPEVERLQRRIGQAIRAERGVARVSIVQLAEASGLNRSTISRIERGDVPARFDQLVAIAGALDISVFRLIEGADDRECQRCELGRSSHVLVCADAGFAAKLGGHTTPAMERRLYELGDE